MILGAREGEGCSPLLWPRCTSGLTGRSSGQVRPPRFCSTSGMQHVAHETHGMWERESGTCVVRVVLRRRPVGGLLRAAFEFVGGLVPSHLALSASHGDTRQVRLQRHPPSEITVTHATGK